MRSLQARLVALQLILSLGVIAAFACSTLWLTSRTLAHEEKRELQSTATQMAESIDHEWVEEGNLEHAAASALIEDKPVGVQIEVLDARRRHVVSTEAPPGLDPREEVRRITVPIRRGGFVVATGSTEPRRKAMMALDGALLLAAAPLFLATLALSRVLARHALRPLSRMAEQADAASRAVGTDPLGEPNDPEEIARLAAAFNRLLGRVGAMLRAERHFTEDAAHELRTPLTVISGELEHAAADPSLDERHRVALHKALSEAREMSALVEALLLLRRADDGLHVGGDDGLPVNLSDLARDLVAELSRANPDRATDITIDADDETLVAGRATLLSAALRNLLANALKFTTPGVPVRVQVSSGESRHSVVVEDGGPGVPPEDMERVFDPFYRGSEARAQKNGFGLGLPLLRRVALAHGGDVTVTRSVLGGAHFRIDVPSWPRTTD